MRKIIFAFFMICLWCVGTAHAVNNCTGATYYDSDSDTCITCPAGYDYNTEPGKTDITQCQIHCDAGTCVFGYTQLEYLESTGTQYIDTGYIPTLNTRTEVDLKFTDDSYASSGNESFFGVSKHSMNFGGLTNQAYQVFPWTCGYSTDTGCNVSAFTISSNIKTTRNTVVLDAKNKVARYGDLSRSLSQIPVLPSGTIYLFGLHAIGNDGTESARVYSRNAGMFVYAARIYEDDILVRDMIPVRRNSDGAIGMYDTVTNTFFGNSGTGTFIAGSDVGTMGGSQCNDVGAGYYASASTVNYGSLGTRTACPAGLTTVGYGAGADEAGDCGHILHVGENTVYLRSVKKTTPSLNIKIGNDIFYGNMTTADVSMHDGNTGKLKLKYDNMNYSVYDDTVNIE